jgi:spore germination protein GerM
VTGPSRRRSRYPIRVAWVTVVVLALVVAAGSCGIPNDHSPRPIAQGALPAALKPQTTTTQIVLSAGTDAVRMFLVRNEDSTPRLAQVTMGIRHTTDLTTRVREVMTELIAEQPASSGATKNLTNTIPSSVRILGLKLDGDVLDLDVSNLDNVESTQQRLAFAQMVFTATDLPGVDAVRFSISGRSAQVPLDTATSKLDQAIDRGDYAQLDPAD